jgi:hypothetical protein
MSKKLWSIAPCLAAGAAAFALAAGPTAFAEGPADCSASAMSTVCQSPGNSNEVAIPQNVQPGGDGGQNGSYGPSGDTPPVGGHH